MSATLDAALIAAHERGDALALVRLYTQAADAASGDEAAFFLTQAYVWALDAGAPEASALNRKLAALGCEEVQPDLC